MNSINQFVESKSLLCNMNQQSGLELVPLSICEFIFCGIHSNSIYGFQIILNQFVNSYFVEFILIQFVNSYFVEFILIQFVDPYWKLQFVVVQSLCHP
jgi:hypothetical protein